MFAMFSKFSNASVEIMFSQHNKEMIYISSTNMSVAVSYHKSNSNMVMMMMAAVVFFFVSSM